MKSPFQLLKYTWQIFAGASQQERSDESPPVSLQTLEDRVMYDASPLAAYAADVSESLDTLNDVDDARNELAMLDANLENPLLHSALPHWFF